MLFSYYVFQCLEPEALKEVPFPRNSWVLVIIHAPFSRNNVVEKRMWCNLFSGTTFFEVRGSSVNHNNK